MRLAVLGDAIAYGVGANHPDDTLAHRLRAELGSRGRAAHPRVFAVPGARSADLGGQVRAAQDWPPQLSVVVIGANDLSHSVHPEEAADDLRAAVRRLLERGSDVVVAPAPDLSIVPHVAPGLRGVVRAASLALRRAQVHATLAEGGRVADADGTTSARFARDPSLFSADRFHPSSAGYAVIARCLLPVVLEATAAATAGPRPA